jgi:hypothetical protein
VHQELSEQLLRIHQAEDRTAFHGGRSLRRLDAANRKVAKSKHRENNMSVRVMSVEEANRLYPPRGRKLKTRKKPAKA